MQTNITEIRTRIESNEIENRRRGGDIQPKMFNRKAYYIHLCRVLPNTTTTTSTNDTMCVCVVAYVPFIIPFLTVPTHVLPKK